MEILSLASIIIVLFAALAVPAPIDFLGRDTAAERGRLYDREYDHSTQEL